MRNFILTTNVLVLLLTSTLLGCTESNPEQNTPQPIESVITLDTATIDVDASENKYSVDYYIENRTEQTAPTLTCDAEWVIDLEATHTSILFGVEANMETAREAVITISYNNTSNTLTVRQAAYEESHPFNITIETMDATSCITSTEALDANMSYIMYLSPVTYFTENEILTAEALIEDDKRAFMSGAEFDDIPVEQYLKNYNTVFKGTTRAEWRDLVPGSKYVVYVYGVEFNEDGTDYCPITDIVYEIITPETAPLREEISFDVQIAVTGPEATFTITPENWNGYYVTDIYTPDHALYLTPDSKADEAYASQVVMAWLNNCNILKINYGFSDQDIIDQMCMKDNVTESIELAANTAYCAVVYAVEIVDGLLQVVSIPVVKNFATEDVAFSEMTIDISVENIYSRVADICVTPSNNDEQYLFLLMPSEYITSHSEADIINELITDYLSYASKFKGEISSHVSMLAPSTEYSIFAFGYYGGVVTTPLFRYDFTTTAAAPGTVQVEEVRIGGPYNPGELAAAMPELFGNYATYADSAYIITMQTITDKPTRDKFYLSWDLETFTYYSTYYPDVIHSDLIAFYCDEVGIELCSFDTKYVVCGIAMDEKGNVGDMWQSQPFSYAADEYVAIDGAIEALKQNDAKKTNATLAHKSLVYNE